MRLFVYDHAHAIQKEGLFVDRKYSLTEQSTLSFDDDDVDIINYTCKVHVNFM